MTKAAVHYLLFFLTFLITENIHSQLNGTYTIGGASPDYATIQAACDDVMAQTVSGPVTFNIRDGIYNEQVNIQYVFSASPQMPITFRSESGDTAAVKIVHDASSDWHTFRVNFSPNIIFEYLTFESTGDPGIALKLDNADSCIVRNCRLVGVPYLGNCCTAPWSSSVLQVDPFHKVYIENNTTIGGGRGIYIDDSSSSIEECIVRNNVVIDAEVAGIGADAALNVSIISNKIITTIDNFFTDRGIQTFNCDSSLYIAQNHITLYDGIGIGVEGTNSSALNPALIVNNSVHIYDGTVATDDHAIHVSDCEHLDIVHNSINCEYSSNEESSAIYNEYGGPNSLLWSSDIRILNNNIKIDDNGWVIIVEEPDAIVECDYNNYFYANGAVMGKWDGNEYTTFGTWKTNTTLDVNTLFGDPNYRTPSNLIPCNLSLEGAAIPYFGISTDHNEFDRDLVAPDIGCHEFYADPCPFDFNDDDEVNASDLLFFLTEFGCTENCETDQDYDCAVGTVELLGFLSAFGDVCD